MVPLFGVRAHDFGRLGPESLARAVREAGFPLIHLAPAKAFIDYPSDADFEAEAAFARASSKALLDGGTGVAVLGSYIDPTNPDPRRRAAELDAFSRAIRLGGLYGSPPVGTETGNRKRGKEEYGLLLEAVSRWAREAEAVGGRIALEPVFGHVLDTPKVARRLIDDVGSPSLGIIYDPANLLDPSDPEEQESLFGEALELLGERIMAVHAKDVTIADGRKNVLPPGLGSMDWHAALRGVSALPLSPPIIIEDLSPAFLSGARAFLQALVEEA